MDLKLSNFGRRQVPPALPGPAQLRAYWEGLRAGAAIPHRQQLDPRGLDGVLDRVFLAEGIALGLVQVSIAGSALSALAGTDLRGLPLSCLFAPEGRPVLAEVLRLVLSGEGLAELDLASDRGRRGTLVARLVLLPLTDAGDRRLVLGAFGLTEGAAPGKFQVLARREERLCLPQAPAPDLPPAPIRQRGHLALVHSA
jgi:hypothetical protein